MAAASTWLLAWERAAAEPPYERALTLLAAAEPEAREDDLAALPIGERDGGLLRLRAQLFGDEASAVVDCPRCSARLEIVFRTSELVAPSPGDARLTFTLGEQPVTLRRVTTADLRAVAAAATAEALLERVIVAPTPSALPPASAWLEEGARRLELADPQAHIEMAMRCPECALDWTAPFDVVSFLWQELDTWAARTLREVHVLASAYGWSEHDILEISPMRRRRYLELVGR